MKLSNNMQPKNLPLQPKIPAISLSINHTALYLYKNLSGNTT